MGFTTAMESFVMLFLSVVLMVQGILTVVTYAKERKPQDLTFFWSWMVIILSGLGMIFSLVIWGSQAKAAVNASGGLAKALQNAVKAA
jgi:hypothetical protein